MKFKLKKKDKRTELEKEIDEIVAKMREIDDKSSNEYNDLVAQLADLTDIQVKGHPVKEVRKIDPNTVMVVLGGLVEIVLIMSYENLHVISTKAFNRILKPRT